MSRVVPCKECGTQILPVTAERTGGTCMPCFKGPVPQDTPPLERWMAANMSSAQLLTLLDRTLVEVCKRVAEVAVCNLGKEGIYGFWLSHHIFTNVYATVFTEAGLDAVTRRYHEQGRLDQTREGLRWSRADSPHHLYLEPVTEQETHPLFSALEDQGRDEAVDLEIERSMLRALRYTRRAGILDPSVVLVLAEADHSPEELLVAAEQFSDPATVAKFRSELIPLREDYLALLRSRVPEY